MKRTFYLTVSVCISLFLYACQKEKKSEQIAPDSIFVGGTVLTVDDQNSVVNAVSVKDGLISQVGEKQTLLKTADEDTDIIDISGKTIIPGFVGAHEHPTLTAVFANTVDMSGFTYNSSDKMWQNLINKIAEANDGDWVFAMGLDPILMSDLELPNIQYLDQIAANNPLVIISQTMHSFWANTKAFEAVDINKTTPDPGQGSYYGKDENGELNGFISEPAAAEPFIKKLQSPLAVLSRYQSTLQDLVDSGYTSVVSAGFNMPPMMAKYASSDNLSPRIRQFIYLREEEKNYLPDSPENGDDFYRILGIKLWYDGSPYTGTMALEEPYLNNSLTRMMGMSKGHKGEARIAMNLFKQQIKKYGLQNWQLAIHSQGDLSSRQSFNAIQAGADDNTKNLRHRFEHCLLIPKSILQGFKSLNLTPSFHINHIYYYGDALASKIIGEQRAQSVLPVKSAFDFHLHPTLHADSPMFPTDPLSLMKTAVTRKTKSGKILGADQAITPQQALRTMTINGAWQIHMEKKLGSIEVGKYADMTILSDNLYQTDPENWNKIEIDQVWLEGERKD